MSYKLYNFQTSRGHNHYGPAAIAGTTKKLTATYAAQPVFLFLQEGFRLVAETRSGADGSYSFTGLLADTDYIVASIDKSGTYNIVAADRVRTAP